MRTQRTVVIGMLTLFILMSYPAMAVKPGAGRSVKQQEGVATLVVKLGRVEIERNGEKIKAKKGMILFEGDVIKTSELSRAALILQDGSLIRLNENTDLQLRVNARKKKKNRLKILLGHLWAKIKKQDTGLEIETPSAVAAIKGTELELLVQSSGLIRLIVWDGLVNFFNDMGKQLVGAAEQSTVTPGKAPFEPTKVKLEKLERWFESVVEIPAVRTLKTTIQDKDGREHRLNIKYNKK